MGEEDYETEEKKEEETAEEIVLRVFLHCEGCARKIRRWLKKFPGVEDVVTDCKSSKVVVKGEKADPLKVLERIQMKNHGKVELLSAIPKSPIDGIFAIEKKVIADVEIQKPKPQEKEVIVDEEIQKPEPQEKKVTIDEEIQKPKPQVKKKEEAQQDLNPEAITIMLRVFMHCEACAEDLKKRIMRMKGVESVETYLKASQVKVIGVFDPSKLTEHVYKKSGKLAMVIEQEPEKKEENENTDKDKDVDKQEKKGEDSAKQNKIGDTDGVVAGVDYGEKNNGGGGDGGEGKRVENEENNVVEMKRNEYNYYPTNYSSEYYAYPPPSDQTFSDENPDACSIM